MALIVASDDKVVGIPSHRLWLLMDHMREVIDEDFHKFLDYGEQTNTLRFSYPENPDLRSIFCPALKSAVNSMRRKMMSGEVDDSPGFRHNLNEIEVFLSDVCEAT